MNSTARSHRFEWCDVGFYAMPLRTLRCLQTFGQLLPLLRHWLCSTRKRKTERLADAPCRTEHRSESWAIPSLCRATPSATSERLGQLLDSSPIFLSFVCFFAFLSAITGAGLLPMVAGANAEGVPPSP